MFKAADRRTAPFGTRAEWLGNVRGDLLSGLFFASRIAQIFAVTSTRARRPSAS